jgi:chromosome segregation protein
MTQFDQLVKQVDTHLRDITDPKLIEYLKSVKIQIKEREKYYNSIPSIIKTPNVLDNIIFILQRKIDAISNPKYNKNISISGTALANSIINCDNEDTITLAYLTEAEEENVRLNKDLNEKIINNDELQKQIDHCNRVKVALSNELQKQIDHCNRVKVALSNELQKQYNNWTNSIEGLQKRNDETEYKFGNIINSCKEEKDQIDHELTVCKEQLANITTHNKQITDDRNKLEIKNQEYLEMKQKLEEKINHCNDVMKGLINNLAEQKGLVNQKEQAIDICTTEIADLQINIQDLVKQINGYNVQMESLEDKFRKEKGYKHQKEKRIEGVKKELDNLLEEKQRFEKRVDECNAEIKLYEDELTEQKARIEREKQKVEKLETEIKSLEEEQKKLNANINELRSNLETCQNANTKCQQEIEKKNTEIKSLEEQQNKNIESEKLARLNNQLKAQTTDLKNCEDQLKNKPGKIPIRYLQNKAITQKKIKPWY